MLDALSTFARSRFYWLLLLLLGLSFEAVALFYQYVLEELPCVICIQVRLWVMALIILALLMLMLRQGMMLLLGHISTIVMATGLLERSYQLLGNERGFIVGACGFDIGLPSWFTPDVWFPLMFQVETTCGYTPELLFGITMAEFLIVSSAAFVLLSVLMTFVMLRWMMRQR